MNGKIYLYSLTDNNYKYLKSGEFNLLKIAEEFKIPSYQQLLKYPDKAYYRSWKKDNQTIIDYGSWSYYLVIKEEENNMMTKMDKTRVGAIGDEINETINWVQKYINNYDGLKQRLVLTINSDTDNLELLKLAICTYLDNSEYKNSYFIKDKNNCFELAFNIKPSINKEELGLMYKNDKYKGIFTFEHFTKKISLKASPIKFNAVSFNSKILLRRKSHRYTFIPLINEMREDRKASK